MRSTAGMAPPQGGPRFSETAKALPVLFVVCNIAGLWAIYMWYHCLPELRSKDRHQKAIVEITAFNIVALLLIICYVQCILVHPGTIPDRDEDASWEYIPQDGRSPANPDGQVLETKKSGDRRYCKWCTKYKPDRCHHCRVCRMCILKMDHHCPWIYNCVGFRNHKYFFLLLLYSAIACHIITWTMLDSVLESVSTTAPFATMFCLLFGETLAAFIGILVTVFFGFHVWLMLKAMTTIEFCEKSRSSKGGAGGSRSAYDRGIGGNIRAVLGDNFLLWLLPVSPPSGRGLKFIDEDLRIAREFETQRGSRRKSQGRPGERREHRHREGRRSMGPTESGVSADDALIKNHGAYGYGAVYDQEDCCDIVMDKRRARRDHRSLALC